MAISGKKRSSLGFSAMEVLVAMTMIGGVFGVLFHFGRINTARVSAESNQTCEQMARSTMDNLRSFGMDRGQAVVSVSANQISYPNTATQTTNAVPWDLTWRLPARAGNPLIVDSATPGGVATSSAYHGTIGVMNVLSELYNSDPRYCSNLEGHSYDVGTLIVKGGAAAGGSGGPKDRFSIANTTLRVQAYDLELGRFGCRADGFPASIFPVPASASGSPTAEDTVAYPPDVSPRYGFWVTVHTSYTDQGGTTGQCKVSSLFQYPRKAIDTSSRLNMAFTFSASNPAVCQTTQPGGRLTVTLPPEASGKSWVLMCRDTSPAPTKLTGPDCAGRVTHQPPGTANTGAWVRCENVTICGVTPDLGGSSWNAGGTILTVNYTNRLPWGCNPEIQGRLVDQARNVVDDATIIATKVPSEVASWTAGPLCNFRLCTPPATGGGFYCAPDPGCTTPPVSPDGSGDGGDGSSDGNADGMDGTDGGGRGGDGCDTF